MMLLYDLQIHTKYSDGLIELKRTVDLYGQACFDIIAITDNVVNGDNSTGKLARRFNLSFLSTNINDYLSNIMQLNLCIRTQENEKHNDFTKKFSYKEAELWRLFICLQVLRF